MDQTDPNSKGNDQIQPQTMLKKEDREKLIQDEIKRISEEMRRAFQHHIGKEIFGFKILVSSEVPTDEVWFIDGYGQKHIMKDVRPSIVFTPKIV